MQALLTKIGLKALSMIMGEILEIIKEKYKAGKRKKAIKNAIKDKNKHNAARAINDQFRSN